jgi:hypothetical protein
VTTRRLRLILPVVAATLVVALMVSRLGQRGFVAFGLLSLVYVFHYLWRRIPVAAFAAVTFLGIAASNLTLEWRTAPQTRARDFALYDAARDPLAVLAAHESERQRFAALAVVMDAFPDRHPYLVGESWISWLVAPVPRWVWPEKVTAFEWQDNRIVKTLSGAPIPTPFVGVLYANFAWLGVLAGMFLFGAFHRGLYVWLTRSPSDPNVVLLYALFATQLTPTSMGLAAALQYILPVYLAIRFIGRGASESSR